MSALSSASRMRARGPRPRRRRGRARRLVASRGAVLGQPAQRLLDVGLGAASRRRRAAPPCSIRSAGRCAAPNGERRRERRARPERALDLDRRRRAASPAPAPAPARCPCPRASAARVPSTRWKRSNRRGSSSGGNADAGVLHRAASTRSPSARSATSMPPSNVNLKAFESRLRTIFSHMSRST